MEFKKLNSIGKLKGIYIDFIKAPSFCIDKCNKSQGGWGRAVYCEKAGKELTRYKRRPNWCPRLKEAKRANKG
jgi:hypothetical protein